MEETYSKTTKGVATKAMGLDYSGVMALCRSVYSSDALTSLNLSSNSLGDSFYSSGSQSSRSDNTKAAQCSRALARVISNNDTLTNMEISNNMFDVDAGRDIMAASFRENSTLTMLNGIKMEIVRIEVWHLA